jgi:hypothetical protein
MFKRFCGKNVTVVIERREKRLTATRERLVRKEANLAGIKALSAQLSDGFR